MKGAVRVACRSTVTYKRVKRCARDAPRWVKAGGVPAALIAQLMSVQFRLSDEIAQTDETAVTLVSISGRCGAPS